MAFPSNPFTKSDSLIKAAKKVLEKDIDKKENGSSKKGEPVDLEPKLEEDIGPGLGRQRPRHSIDTNRDAHLSAADSDDEARAAAAKRRQEYADKKKREGVKEETELEEGSDLESSHRTGTRVTITGGEHKGKTGRIAASSSTKDGHTYSVETYPLGTGENVHGIEHKHIQKGINEETDLEEGYKVGDLVVGSNPKAKPKFKIVGKSDTHYHLKHIESGREVSLTKKRIADANAKRSPESFRANAQESTELDEAFHSPLAKVLTDKGFRHTGSSEEDFRKTHIYSHADGHTAKVYPANRGKVASVVVKHKDGKITDAFNVDQLKRGLSSVKESVDLEESSDFSVKFDGKTYKFKKGEEVRWQSVSSGKEESGKFVNRGTDGSTIVVSVDGTTKKVHLDDLAYPEHHLREESELDEKTLTPAELKKREEIAKAIERENPGIDKSKKMAIATATAKKVAEEIDQHLSTFSRWSKTASE